MRMDVNISLASVSIPLMQISAFQHKIITMHINISYTMLWIIMRCFFVTEWKFYFCLWLQELFSWGPAKLRKWQEWTVDAQTSLHILAVWSGCSLSLLILYSVDFVCLNSGGPAQIAWICRLLLTLQSYPFIEFMYIWCAMCEKGPYAICGQCWPWSACAKAQADLGLRCPLLETMDTEKYMSTNRECSDQTA